MDHGTSNPESADLVRDLVRAPMTADEVLQMAGIGLDFDNEQIRALSTTDDVT